MGFNVALCRRILTDIPSPCRPLSLRGISPSGYNASNFLCTPYQTSWVKSRFIIPFGKFPPRHTAINPLGNPNPMDKLGRRQYKILLHSSPFCDSISPRCLRRTYATDLYAAGVDVATQKAFLGHSSCDVTDRYRMMNDAVFYRALDAINVFHHAACAKNVPD